MRARTHQGYSCLLDTSALLTLRDDESGADRVALLLQQA